MKTNAKHFKLFKKEVERWVLLLGIIDWRITIEHKDSLNDNDIAWCLIDSAHKSCSIMLSKEWGENNPKRDALKRCAFHETCHVRLSQIDDMLTALGYSQERSDKVLHGLIYTLENCIFGIGES